MRLVEGLGKGAGVALLAVPMIKAITLTQAQFRRIIIKHLGLAGDVSVPHARHCGNDVKRVLTEATLSPLEVRPVLGRGIVRHNSISDAPAHMVKQCGSPKAAGKFKMTQQPDMKHACNTMAASLCWDMRLNVATDAEFQSRIVIRDHTMDLPVVAWQPHPDPNYGPHTAPRPLAAAAPNRRLKSPRHLEPAPQAAWESFSSLTGRHMNSLMLSVFSLCRHDLRTQSLVAHPPISQQLCTAVPTFDRHPSHQESYQAPLELEHSGLGRVRQPAFVLRSQQTPSTGISKVL